MVEGILTRGPQLVNGERGRTGGRERPCVGTRRTAVGRHVGGSVGGQEKARSPAGLETASQAVARGQEPRKRVRDPGGRLPARR